MTFQFTPLEIPDVLLIESKAFEDARGLFVELYKRTEFASAIPQTFVQDNYSRSRHGVLRGLHYQIGANAQGKLVRVLRGEIFDVAVDIRRDSENWGKWVGTVLSARNHRLLYIPEGFAHGFCVLSGEADVIYKVTSEHAPASERGIIWNDLELGIDWPMESPVLSSRDSGLPGLREAEISF